MLTYTYLSKGNFDFVVQNSDHGGADVVLEVAGAESTFELFQCKQDGVIKIAVEC